MDEQPQNPEETKRPVGQSDQGAHAEPLDGPDKERWALIGSQIDAIAGAASDGTLDAETLAGGSRAVSQVPLDMSTVLDALHVPADAGEHAAGLERMLRRIPNGWGRWVSCDAGWYPLLVRLDENISALLPEYEIHQMKEKYGTLRFYWGLPELLPVCCQDLNETDPRPLPEAVSGPTVPTTRTPEAQATMEAWFDRLCAHLDSPEHAKGRAALVASVEVAHRNAAAGAVGQLVADAEAASAHTCERCGAPARMCSQGVWMKTLCVPCRDELGYEDYEYDEDD
jgi:hypothetical protein